MSTEKTWQIDSTSSADTERLGEHIGARLRGGEVIELQSDLGGGKTTFTRGLARGAGSVDRVASPTFTISREYRAADFTIVHYDFYRLNEAGIMEEELREAAHDSQTVTIVEWGEVVRGVLPDRRLTLTLTRSGDETRVIRCGFPDELSYLLEGMQT